jgi:hypothetical protein
MSDLAHTLYAGTIPAVSEKEFPVLVEAYRALLTKIDASGSGHLAGRLPLLFCFGFDEQGELPSGPTTTAADLKARLKLVTQAGKYSNLPGQRDKLKNFLPFAADAEQVLETLRHLRYRLTRRADSASSSFSISLVFWGFVLTGLLSEKTRLALVEDMLGDTYALPEQHRYLAILHETAQAVMPMAAGDAAFADLGARLAAIQQARRDATESVALARQLGLPFGDQEAWSIRIALHLDGNPAKRSYAPDLSLEIAPDPDYPWRLHLRTDAGQFSEWAGSVSQNDLGIQGVGQLHAFPAWLRSTRERHGLSFVLDDPGNISCGRKRAAAKLIEAWLASPAG